MGDESEPAVAELKQDIRGGRVAQSYLLAGPSGAAKEEAADSFARALLCLHPEEGEACGSCPSCRHLLPGTHPDFHRLSLEGGSIKLEQVKSWRPFFNYRPQLGRYQVFWLTAPEKMTLPAANSLLKILEEPLPRTVFILVTEDESALLPTIVSRCRVVLFHRSESTGEAIEMPEEGEDIRHLLFKGNGGELLGLLRRRKYDRERGRRLLRWLLADLETSYRRQRQRALAGEEESLSLLPVLQLLLRGLELLDENVQVPLTLAMTLRQVQVRLRRAGER